jgi:hypothetical protein
MKTAIQKLRSVCLKDLQSNKFSVRAQKAASARRAREHKIIFGPPLSAQRDSFHQARSLAEAKAFIFVFRQPKLLH